MDTTGFEALFLREYFPLARKVAVQKLTSTITEEFMNLLRTSDLHDDVSKNQILQKANTISFDVGAPDELFDANFTSQLVDDTENLNTNDLLTMASILSRQAANRAIRGIDNIIYHHNYYEDIAWPDDFYCNLHNKMIIPAGILQGLLFDENRPSYLNFASFGTTLAYHLVRSLTHLARLNDVLEHTTEVNFHNKTQCLIEQASRFSIENTQLHTDGKRVLNENFYDLTAVKVAHLAYEDWIEKHGEEKQLPGLTYTPRQLYWISTASLFCENVSFDELRNFITTSKTAHPTYRMFNALSNTESFAKDFNCPAGSKMNPSNKCEGL